MNKHTTHFDDCGCLSERLEAQKRLLAEGLAAANQTIAALEAELVSVKRLADEDCARLKTKIAKLRRKGQESVDAFEASLAEREIEASVLRSRLADSQAALAAAVGALEFYAEPFTWARVNANARHMGATDSYNFDHEFGTTAREALATIKGAKR